MIHSKFNGEKLLRLLIWKPETTDDA